MLKSLMAGKKVLVVDDDEANQFLMQLILQELGCGFEIVANGQEAVEKARTGEFALIFMDLRMPVMNGYDATKAIREFNKNLPIIALTAHAMEWVPSQCFDIGMNDFISKPFNRDKIKEEVVKWLSK